MFSPVVHGLGLWLPCAGLYIKPAEKSISGYDRAARECIRLVKSEIKKSAYLSNGGHKPINKPSQKPTHAPTQNIINEQAQLKAKNHQRQEARS